MLFKEVFEGFIAESPISVMNRMILEYMLPPAKLDALFERCAESQYTQELLFSSVVNLMSQVVLRTQPSICAAYRKDKPQLGVSIQAVYDKLKGVETQTSRELVVFTAREATTLIDQMGGTRTSYCRKSCSLEKKKGGVSC